MFVRVKAMGTFSVSVVDDDGHSVSGATVTVDFGSRHGSSTKYTDDSGWAEFANSGGDLVTGEFYVNSRSFGSHSTHDGDTYSFTI